MIFMSIGINVMI